MQACSYCGRENENELAACKECGVELVAQSEPTLKRNRVFFRWKVAAIFLWIQIFLYGLFSLLNFWMGQQVAKGTIHYRNFDSHQCYRGAIENGFVAIFTFIAWYLMRPQKKQGLILGSLAVSIALFITLRRWLYWEIHGPNDLPWAEPLLIWPCFVYAIVYAYRASKTAEKNPETSA